MAVVDLQGVWIHDPAEPLGTAHHFRFNGDGAKETLTQSRVFTQYAGRAFAVVDFGEDEGLVLAFTVACESETDDLEQLRAFGRARTTLCYRDSKGRYAHGVLDVGITDDWWGAGVDCTFTATDFTPRPYTPPPVLIGADLTTDELEAITAAAAGAAGDLP